MFAVLLIAGIVRIAMLVDFLRSHPGAYVMNGDAGAYWSMAAEIAAGRMVGPEPFLSAPLYPYFLAIIRALGGGLLAVYAIQIGLHLLTAFLIFRLVTRKLDDRAGLGAAGLFLLMLEPAFYLTRILPTTLQLLVVVVAMSVAEASVRRRSLPVYAALGACVGALALIYPTAIVGIVVLPVWIFRREFRGSPPRESSDPTWALSLDHAWEKAIVSVFVALLVMLPATLHNWAATGEFIPITAHGGITLRQGNVEGADGIYTPLSGISATRERMHEDALVVFERETGMRGGYGEVDRFFRNQALNYLSSDWRHATWLTVRKGYWFLTGRHYSDLVYPTLEQRDGWIHLLPLAPIKTAWLMGSALMGILVGRRIARINGWDVLLLLLPFATVCLFWFSPRYRIPALPALVVFSVLAWRGSERVIVNPVAAARGSHPSIRRFWLALLILVSILTGPVNSWTGFDRAEAYRPQYEFNRGQVYVVLRQYESAVAHFELSDRLAPDHPGVLTALADAYGQTERLQEAETTARRLINLAPKSPIGWNILGGLYLRFQHEPQAAAAFREALALDARDPQTHLGLALALVHSPQSGREVESHFRRAIKLRPTHVLAVCEFGRWLFQQDRKAEAEPLLRQCAQFVPDRPDTGEMLRELQAAGSGLDQHLDWLHARIAAAPTQPELYSELAGEFFQRGRTAEAIQTLRDGVSKASDHHTLLLELAWVLATTPDAALPGEGDRSTLRRESVVLAERAVAGVDEPGPESLDVLAAALAAAGRFPDAAQTARRAYDLALAAGNETLAAAIRERAELYERNQAYRRE